MHRARRNSIMGFEPNDERVEINKVDTQFEGGGVDVDSGDLSEASPVAAPKRTMRERRSVRARAVSGSAQVDNPRAGTAPDGQRRPGYGAPPVRRPIMRSNSEFGYLFSDTEPTDNHMDEQYSHRLDGLAYDGKTKGEESQYSDLFENQQSMVRRPENRSSAAFEPRPAQPAQPDDGAPAGGTSRRPKFSRRNREDSAANAYAAANAVSAAELAARADGTQPAQEQTAAPDGRSSDRHPARPEDEYYPRDRRYEDDRYYDDYDYDYRYGRRYADRRGPYEGQPEYPPYGQYGAYPPNYPYGYPYGQYPVYPPYGQYPPGYPPYGYPPYGYPPGYGYPGQPENTEPAAQPPQEEPAPADVIPVAVPVNIPPRKAEREPVYQPEPRPAVVFPDDSSDSVDEEFAGLDSAPSSRPEQPEPAAEAAPAAQPERPAGSGRFNRRSRSGSGADRSSAPESSATAQPEQPVNTAQPAEAKEQADQPSERRFKSRSSRSSSYDWSDSSGDNSPSDWFGDDSSGGGSAPSGGRSSGDSAGGSSRFNRRSRS